MKTKHILAVTILLTMLATAASAFAQGNAPASFNSLKELIDLLPHPLVQQLKITAKIEDARQRANDLFKQNAVGKTATMKVRASEWHEENGTDNVARMKIWIVPVPMNILGTTFTVRMWITVRKDQAAPLTKIAKGGEITATGKLERFVLSPERGKLLLDGDLSDATLETK